MSVLCKTEEIIIDTHDYNSDETDDVRLTVEDSGGDNYHHKYHSSGDQLTNGNTIQRQDNQNLSVNLNHHLIQTSGKTSSKNIMENEKRMRREIANSNERRRMQSINAGFQSLRSLLPRHEGEKLSKAAILQQTAQYIIELEREKTDLLSQNSQLKRLLGQHEIGSGGGNGGGGGGPTTETTNPTTIKKRKLTDTVMTIQTISDSSDEGLGSMSPEPVTLLTGTMAGTKTSGTAYISTSGKEIAELKNRLESERKRRTLLEERLRQLEHQIYPNQYIHREVIEHTDNIREEEIAVSLIPDPLKLQVVEIEQLPTVGQTQVVVCSSLEEMQQMQEEDDCDPMNEEIMHTVTDLREEVIIRDDSADYVEVPSRLQPILEAAIKAEPKVEVERINATLTKIKEEPNTITNEATNNKQSNSRMYLTNTSRQNLETIVEAIRHLEGDHLFSDTTTEQKKSQTHSPAQDLPLALTNKPQQQQQQQQRKQLPVELTPFLQLKKPIATSAISKNTITVVTPASGLMSSNIPIATQISCSNSNNLSNSSNSLMGTNSNNINSNSTSSNTTSNCGSTLIKTQTSLVNASTNQITIGTASLKQCRPGVIVAKQIS